MLAVITTLACAIALGVVAVSVSWGPPGESAHASASTPRPTQAAKGAARAVHIKPRVGIETFNAPKGIRIDKDVAYSTVGGSELKLDVCSPAVQTSSRLPAVLAIHGGSWAHGDKADAPWRTVCQWLASQGFVAFSVDYRLVPSVHFPAAINDVARALKWVRESDHAERFNVDPARIGVLGGSAGGNLAALLGMRGHGDLTSGTRVAAVVELSGPVDLTAAGQKLGQQPDFLRDAELAYLDCTSFDHCPAAADASPITFVDSSDPPVFIGASTNELVPVQQDQAFAKALAAAGVPHTLHVNRGHWHSIATLGAPMRAAVAEFLHQHLD